MGERPNFVVFVPDQLRADALGCFGNPVARTPNIDALAARGTRFAEAYAQHSVCSPSRVSLMTGWYPHTSGHRTLTDLLKPWEPNLLRVLRDSGYHVAWAGHRGDLFAPGVTEASTDFSGFLVEPTHWISSPRREPGDKWFDAYYHGRRDGTDPVLDLDEATVRTAERFLADAPPEPWFLFVALFFPHCPFEVEEPWFSLHDRADMPPPLPPAAGKPRFHELLRAGYGTERLDARDWAEIAAVYHGMVSRVDSQLGRVVAAAERAAAPDRTVTVFLTDHGEYLGDFGLVEKWPSGLDRCLLHNPLIVSAPGFGPGVAAAPVELVDVLPTVLELAEVEARHTHFGRSLVPLLADPEAPHRDVACSEGGFLVADEPRFERAGSYYATKTRLEHEDPAATGKATALRTDRFTYVHRLEEGDELYDRSVDPHEARNVVDDPAHADVVAQLRQRLLDWLVETSDAVPWEPDPRFPEIPHGYRDAARSSARG